MSLRQWGGILPSSSSVFYSDYFPPRHIFFLIQLESKDESLASPLMIMLSDLALRTPLLSSVPNVIFCTFIIYSVPQLNENIHHQILNSTLSAAISTPYFLLLLPKYGKSGL